MSAGDAMCGWAHAALQLCLAIDAVGDVYAYCNMSIIDIEA
jgi:hypothetical protein